MKQFKQALKQVDIGEGQEDIHNTLMKSYRDVPEYAYGIYLLVMMVFFAIVTQVTAYKLPIEYGILGVIIGLVAILPCGIVLGSTGTGLYLNVISQVVIGLLIPGKTISVMAFKSLVTNNGVQAFSLLTDLKLGHYMKIPPLSMIGAQLFGTFIGSIVSTMTAWWMITDKEWIKTLLNVPAWFPNGYLTFYNAGLFV